MIKLIMTPFFIHNCEEVPKVPETVKNLVFEKKCELRGYASKQSISKIGGGVSVIKTEENKPFHCFLGRSSIRN